MSIPFGRLAVLTLVGALMIGCGESEPEPKAGSMEETLGNVGRAMDEGMDQAAEETEKAAEEMEQAMEEATTE